MANDIPKANILDLVTNGINIAETMRSTNANSIQNINFVMLPDANFKTFLHDCKTDSPTIISI
ncbi:hypothetical protein AGMMS49990_05930 [Endomicrobiia bacterium]|nr:hypothetical protein AGMMS49990_05930 [Endomicrobiia bacterium]